MTQPPSEKPLPQPTDSSNPSRSSTLQSFVAFARRRAWILVGVALLFVAVMVIGILFIAHDNFHSYGGQGFLRARYLQRVTDSREIPFRHLPIRQLASPPHTGHILDYMGIKRSPGVVPFFRCGDQQNSCEAYGQPAICCPVGMNCHLSSDTTSGVYCCNSSAPFSDCQPSASKPPQCPVDTFECASIAGGGCCPTDSDCSPNGCIQSRGANDPALITSTLTSTLVTTVESKVLFFSQLATETREREMVSTITLTSTLTTVIGGASSPTATIVKEGEVAQKGEGVRHSMLNVVQKCFSPAMMLAFVAVGMLLL